MARSRQSPLSSSSSSSPCHAGLRRPGTAQAACLHQGRLHLSLMPRAGARPACSRATRSSA